MFANVFTTNKVQTKLNTDRRYNDQTTRKKKFSHSLH